MRISDLPYRHLPPFARHACDVCGRVIRQTDTFDALRHPRRLALRRAATALFEQTLALPDEDDGYFRIVERSDSLAKELRRLRGELRRSRHNVHWAHLHIDLQSEPKEKLIDRFCKLIRPGRVISLLEETELQKKNCSHSGDFMSIECRLSRHLRPIVTHLTVLERFYWLKFAGNSHVSRIADLLAIEPSRDMHEDGTQELGLQIVPPLGAHSVRELFERILQGIQETPRRLRRGGVLRRRE